MKFEDLPSILPLYEADGVILLPRAQLPLLLNNFEEKTLFDYSINDKNRLVGVVQSNPDGGHFNNGCLGRIIGFQEGMRLFVTLGGICRFKIEEIVQDDPIKMARVNYEAYEEDMKSNNSDPFVNRTRLLTLLKDYLEDLDIYANWEEIDDASDDLIISSLSMVCPFKPIEKQALLETETLAQRCDVMIALMEMSASFSKGRAPVIH